MQRYYNLDFLRAFAMMLGLVIHAPIIFYFPGLAKTLGIEKIAPTENWVFVMIAFLSAIGLTIAFMQDNLKLTLIFMISAWLMLLCYFIVPATNRARDSGNQKRFSLLHTLSVVSTIAVLLINLLWIFF